jgi:hypothetical protein
MRLLNSLEIGPLGIEFPEIDRFDATACLRAVRQDKPGCLLRCLLLGRRSSGASL